MNTIDSNLCDSAFLSTEREGMMGDTSSPLTLSYEKITVGLGLSPTNPPETWSGWLASELRRQDSPYTRYLHSGLELHFDPLTAQSLGDDDTWDSLIQDWPVYAEPFTKRIPRNGNGEVIDNDDLLAFNPNLIRCAGTNWWNYRERLTEAMGIDFDADHSNAQGNDGIQHIDELATHLPYVLNVSSKGGKGRHWTVFVEPMPAPTRRHHLANCEAILAQLSEELKTDIGSLSCSSGSIMYIYHFNPAPDGLKLVKGVSL
jgi:hypothetical protein